MEALKSYGWMLLEGVRITMAVAIAAMGCAVIIGFATALARLRGGAGGAVAGVYTTVFRGVPEIVLLLLVYYGLPALIQDVAARFGTPVRLDLDPFAAGVLTLSLIYGAFACEVFRSAYRSVPGGQREAALALGLHPFQVQRLVLVPQVLRLALPGLGNVWMVLIKATALVSIIQLPELMRNTDLAARATRMPLTFYLATCAIYRAITAVSMTAQARAERWASRSLVRT